MTMSNIEPDLGGRQIAAYRAVGTGRMTVDRSGDGYSYTFRITGRTNTLTISDDEAAELAAMILWKRRKEHL
jgi:hypothetical protein